MITVASAQRAAERKEEIKKGLKETVQLSEPQIVSVMSIEAEYRPKLRAVRTDSVLTKEEKQARSNLINKEKLDRLITLLGEAKAMQVQKFYTELKSGSKKEKKGA